MSLVALLVALSVGAGAQAPASGVAVTGAVQDQTGGVLVGAKIELVNTDPSSNVDAVTVDADMLDNLPIFDRDLVATMSRFLDTSALGNGAVTIVVNDGRVATLRSTGVGATAPAGAVLGPDHVLAARTPRGGLDGGPRQSWGTLFSLFRMNIAVVGDVHGHLALMYAILGRWQRETGRHISLILQVGDLGTFLPTSPLDHATRRFSDRDADELGFGEFAGSDPPKTLLDPRPPLVFIPGNHEDFEFLALSANRVSIDQPVYPGSADGRIQVLRSGRVWTFVEGDQQVRIGGVSGAANLRRKSTRHERCHLQEDEALQLAAAGRGAFDLLIAHDRPDRLWGVQPGPDGSAALRLVVETVAPRFAFFGHYNRGGEWLIDSTRVIGLSDCGYDHARDWCIDEDGVGVVEWTDTDTSFARVAPEWLKRSTKYNWRRWGVS